MIQISITELATEEEKLLEIADALEQLKNVLGDIAADLEEEGVNTELLDDAMEAMDDAIDSLGDAVDELEEEEYELDDAEPEE